MFQVGEFGRLAGVSANVLRDYDRLGLFRPAWVDRASGYRRYSPAQLPELRRILALRDLGVGLREIQALATEGIDLRLVLERRRAALEAQRREVDRRLAALGISIAEGDAGAGTAGRGASAGPVRALDVVVRRIPAELVATLAVELAGGDEGRAFYELELAIRDLGVRAPRPPGSLTGEGGFEVFVPIRRAAPGLTTRRLPAIRAASVLHHGPYADLARTQARLEAWVAGAGEVVVGPLRTGYLQFGAETDLRLPARYVVDRASDLVTELQLPLG